MSFLPHKRIQVIQHQRHPPQIKVPRGQQAARRSPSIHRLCMRTKAQLPVCQGASRPPSLPLIGVQFHCGGSPPDRRKLKRSICLRFRGKMAQNFLSLVGYDCSLFKLESTTFAFSPYIFEIQLQTYLAQWNCVF